MKKITVNNCQIFFSLFILLVIYSCNSKTSTDIDILNYDCEFEHDESTMDGKIDATEKSLMNHCEQYKFTLAKDIEDNLIGEWTIIGYANGWRYNVTQPCAYIKIKKDELIFSYENKYSDTITHHSWKIIENVYKNKTTYGLKVEPEIRDGLWINCFSENYMFYNGTPFDGNMFIYTKVD